MQSDHPLVFIVDDDSSVRNALRRLIRAAGYEVETFATAADFLRRDPSRGGVCLVLDIRMPGMSGLDLQRELTARASRLPVVLITAHADAAVRQQALAGGAVDVLYKPFDDELLLGAIERALEREAPPS